MLESISPDDKRKLDGFLDAAKRQFAQRRQRAEGDTGTGQKTAAINFARPISRCGTLTLTTHGFSEKHEYFSYRGG